MTYKKTWLKHWRRKLSKIILVKIKQYVESKIHFEKDWVVKNSIKQNAWISIIKPFNLVPDLTNCLLLCELAWRFVPLSDEFSSPENKVNFLFKI